MKSIRAQLLVTLVATVVVVVVIFHKDARIVYHRGRMAACWAEIVRRNPPDSRQSDLIEAYERHRDRLVDLGFFVRREFPLTYISVPSLESRRLWEELAATFPDHTTATMQGYEAGTRDMIIVWDRPKNLSAWAEIIHAHNQPPGQVRVKDATQMSRFLGTWGDEDGNVYYVISGGLEGPIKITSPKRDPWQSVIKNIHLDGDCLAFDIYYYIAPSGDYKSPVDQSGEHSFSGVRNHTVLRLSLNDPDAIKDTMSAIPPEKPYVSDLRRIQHAGSPEGKQR